MLYVTRGEKETIALGVSLSAGFTGGEIIALNGDLGAGKTAFSKGVARGLGIAGDVTSPTFAILNVYNGAKLQLCHFDAYRLKDSDEAASMGLDEYFGHSNNVCVIEWAEIMSDLLKYYKVININIKAISETVREIRVDR